MFHSCRPVDQGRRASSCGGRCGASARSGPSPHNVELNPQGASGATSVPPVLQREMTSCSSLSRGSDPGSRHQGASWRRGPRVSGEGGDDDDDGGSDSRRASGHVRRSKAACGPGLPYLPVAVCADEGQHEAMIFLIGSYNFLVRSNLSRRSAGPCVGGSPAAAASLAAGPPRLLIISPAGRAKDRSRCIIKVTHVIRT
ncbi:hypothetical protein GQ55_6G207700 [Panicum hallii var. hallii]|uniref:Uncharacterized protein n=1 Tax=Panicum hallii var. hallii TaxID=1504633 RepID=A0A2T7D7X7_9POAL|nr:hypothetical protein GQ55_6G207700 [Panicum hallii var. hallii]